jgi:ubiquitin C-terminal hydrolase/ubiquinone/menaquinone biosynthesis C-methylase UbiE
MEIIFDKNGYDFLRKKENYKSENIEFELRFGKMSDKKFQPSLFPQETINRIRDYVENTLRLKKISTVTTVHIMDNKIRQVIDDKGFSYFERKEAITPPHDINYNDFTLRMSLSKEDKISPPSTLPKIIETRMRKRDEFKGGPYTYVFTTITKKKGDNVDNEFDEFEIEVTPFGNAEENVKKVVSDILPFIAEDKVNRYLPINTQNTIRKDYKSFEAKPRNLERTDIITIRTKEYSVTNKLDGERFMIVLNNKGLYAVNKRLVDQIEKTSFPFVTILDTELFKGYFHVFDCMMYQGEDITSKKHDYRLKCASECVSYVSKSGILPNIIMKEFGHVKDTHNLLTYLHRNSDIYESNDGIVYTPNDIYRSRDIYKWKFPEKMSIDFRVQLIKQLPTTPYTYELQLYDEGDVFYVFNGSSVFPLSREEATFVSDEPLIDGGIYEFKYENEKFVLMRERPDKVKPNFRTTGESVWDDIKNPFTEKELLELLSMPLKAFKELPSLPVGPPPLQSKSAFKIYTGYHNTIKDELIQKYCGQKMILDFGSGRGGDLGKYEKAGIEYLWAVEPFKSNYDEFKIRLNKSYKTLKDKTILIETGAQSTKKITDAMGREKVDVITSFFSLSFFFFKNTPDLKQLVRTIAATLKVGGIFIGTTIDGKRTGVLLNQQSPFNFDGGYLKWIDDGNVEVFMDGIVGTQTESLVNFQLLCDELKEHDIILESTDFFKEKLALTESLRVLNSLYRTFVFRRKPSSLDNIIRSQSDEGRSLIDVVLKRLTMTEYSKCFDDFKKLLKFYTKLKADEKLKINESFILGIRFPSNEDDEKYCGKYVKDMTEFENGYIHINPFITYNESLNFAKTYSCIQTKQGYLLVTSPYTLLSSKYVTNDYVMISILLQLYYSLLALSRENGYFTSITSSNIAIRKRTDIKQIIYNGVAVDVIDGVVLVFNGYENYAQTDKPISFETIFDGMKISETFASLIKRIPPYINNNGIKTLRKSILDSYHGELLHSLMPSLYTAPHKDMINHLYKYRKDELFSYLTHLYKIQNKRFTNEKVERMMTGTDGEILTFLRKELHYQRDEAKDLAFAQNRGQNRARDIKDLLTKGGVDHITSYMDFGGADGSITSIVAKEFNIPAEKTLCVDLASWGNMHHDQTRNVYKDYITFVPVNEGDKDIPLPNESVMFITSLQVLHHMPDPQHTIDEFYRVLGNGGVVFLREHDSSSEDDNKMFDLIHILYEIVLTENPTWSYRDGPQPVYRSNEGWRQMFEKAGFKSVKATTSSKKDSNRVFHEVFIKERISPSPSPSPLLLPFYDPDGDDSDQSSSSDYEDDSSSSSSSSSSDDEDDNSNNEDIHPFATPYPISTRFGKTNRSMRGIENAGNTCYLNAGIQSIVTALPIMQYFCNINRGNSVYVNKDTKTEGELVSIFSDLVCDLTTVDNPKPEPIPRRQIRDGIKSMIDKLDEDFIGYKQQDSSEFIVKILDGLHGELAVEKTVENRAGTSFIRELFGGRYTTKMECVTCGYKKIRTNFGMSIELPIEDDTKTIDEALVNYSAIEQITDLRCEVCQTKRIFNQKIVMSHAPEILVTSFKRFKNALDKKGNPKYDKKGKAIFDRRNNKLSFPEDLVITQENEEDEGTSDISYSLYAIVNQIGSMEGGHYTANIKNGDDWWLCDDDDVENVEKTSKLLKDNKNAYVLFYHRKE